LGNARDVLLGTALARDVKLSFEPLHGQTATHLLGCFSIGGDAGMTLEAVASLLGKNVLEVKRTVEQLSAAGVLDVSRENRISVHPFRLCGACTGQCLRASRGLRCRRQTQTAETFPDCTLCNRASA